MGKFYEYEISVNDKPIARGQNLKKCGKKQGRSTQHESYHLEIYSEIEKEWIKVKNVLADTGADISILPKNTGELIITDITSGKVQEVKCVVPYAKVVVYVHNLKFRINSREFELPVAIADSNDVLPILGRVKGLDLFDADFNKGKTVSLEE